MIEIPADRLSDELLDAVIEDYVLREGTEYGLQDVPLATKIRQVRAQINRGEVLVLFDPELESCNLVTRQQLRRWRAEP
ncbi:MAG: hypothetical protein CMK32_13190 [Porticoccaceae bacterium]|nr:hypothetical protein [Porticoccaceae bacterium]